MSSTMFIDGNAEVGDNPSDSICVELLGEPLAKHGSCTFYKAMRYKTTKTNGTALKTEDIASAESRSSQGGDNDSSWNTVLLNRFYAVRPWSDSDTICIGELELLWQDDAAKDGDEYGDDSSSSSNDGTNKKGCSTSASVNGRLPSNYHAEQLASLRLYIMPDQTPMGRNSTHGEDEVLEITDRIVLRAKDMVAWIRGATNNDIGENSVSKTNALNIPSNGCRSVKKERQEDVDENVKQEAVSEVDKRATIKTETDVETDRRESNEGNSRDNQQIIPLLACAINYTDVLNYDSAQANSNNKQPNASLTTQALNNDLSAANPSMSEDLVVMSYSRYCRYRAMLKRLEEILVPDECSKETENAGGNKTVFSSLKNRLIVNSLGGDDFYVEDGASEHRNDKCVAAVDRNIKRVLFCRDTFDYPELETHEMLCNHLAPKLKGPSFRWNRVKAMAASSAAAAAAAAAAQQTTDDSDDDDDSHVEGSESSTGSESRFSGVKRGRPSGSSNGANGTATGPAKKANAAAQSAAASSHAKNLQYIEQKLNGVAAIPVPKPAPNSSKRRKLQHPQQIIQQQYQHQYQIQSQLIQQQYQQRFLPQHGHQQQQQKSHYSPIAEHMTTASREQLDLVDALRQGGLEVTPIVVHNNPESGGGGRSSNSGGVRRRYSNSSSNCTYDDGDADEDDEVNIITVTPDVVCILNKPDNSENSPVNFSTSSVISGGNTAAVTGPGNKKKNAANVECPTLPSETSITPSSNVGGGDNRTMQLHRKINQAIDSLKEQIQENNNGSNAAAYGGRQRPLPQRLSNGGGGGNSAAMMSDSNAATNWLLNNDNITVAVLNSSSSNRGRGSSPSTVGRSYQSQVLDLTSNHRRNSSSSATSSHHNSAAAAISSSAGPIDLAMNKPNRAPSIHQSQQQQHHHHHHHNVGSNLEITIVPSVTTSHHLLNQGATTASSRQQIYTNPTSAAAAAKPSLTVRQQLQQRSAGVAAANSGSGGGGGHNRSRTKQASAAAAGRQNQQNVSNITASTTAAMLQQEYLNNLYGQMLQQRQSFEALAAAFNTPHQQQQLFLLAAAAQQARQQAQSQQNKNNNNRGVNKD